MSRPRYFVFCYEAYYPLGGMKDLIYAGNDEREGREWFNKCIQELTRSEDEVGGGAQFVDLSENTVEVVKISWGEVVEKDERNIEEMAKEGRNIILI